MAFRTEEIWEEFEELSTPSYADLASLGGFQFVDRDERRKNNKDAVKKYRAANREKFKAWRRVYEARIKAEQPTRYAKKKAYHCEYRKKNAAKYAEADRRYVEKVKADPVRHAAYLERRRATAKKSYQKKKAEKR